MCIYIGKQNNFCHTYTPSPIAPYTHKAIKPQSLNTCSQLLTRLCHPLPHFHIPHFHIPIFLSYWNTALCSRDYKICPFSTSDTRIPKPI